MTVLMTPHIPQWAQAVALICTIVGFLFVVVESHINEGTAKRLVAGCALGVVLILLWGWMAPSVVQAAVYVGCDHQITWLDWVWWIC